MDDKKLRILILTKLYELNRQKQDFRNDIFEVIDKEVSPEQLNFAFQYLGTSGLIENASSHNGGVYKFYPQLIKGKGIDLIENLVTKTAEKIKNESLINASTMLDKILIFATNILTNPDFFETALKIFDKLIEALQIIF